MPYDVGSAQGREGAGSDVKRQEWGSDACLAQCAEHFVSEVKPGGRGSDGARLLGVDSLVLRQVGGHRRPPDVMRQRGHPRFGEDLFERNRVVALDQGPPGPAVADDLERAAVLEDEPRAVLEPPMRARKRLPRATDFAAWTHQEKFDGAA